MRDHAPAAAREPQAVDQARVVQLVGEGAVVRAEDRGQQRDVRLIAGREEERRFRPLEAGEARLDPAMQRGLAAQQARGRSEERRRVAVGDRRDPPGDRPREVAVARRSPR